jgi:predicted RNase H-like nuclease
MLKGILAISGHSGLFKMVSNAKNALIVESLVDKKRMPAYATSKISALEDIAIFTYEGDVQLAEVFKNIKEKENGGKAVSHKASGNELKAYMEEVLPNYDQERVYVSDMKKVFQWYNLLQENNLLEEVAEEETVENTEE